MTTWQVEISNSPTFCFVFHGRVVVCVYFVKNKRHTRKFFMQQRIIFKLTFYSKVGYFNFKQLMSVILNGAALFFYNMRIISSSLFAFDANRAFIHLPNAPNKTILILLGNEGYLNFNLMNTIEILYVQAIIVCNYLRQYRKTLSNKSLMIIIIKQQGPTFETFNTDFFVLKNFILFCLKIFTYHCFMF